MSADTMAEAMHHAAEVMDMMATAVEAGKRVPHFSIVLRDYARLMEGGARKIEAQRRLAKIGRAVHSIVNLSVNSDEGAGGHVAVWNGEQVGDCFSTAAELLEHLLGAAGTAGER